VAAVTPPAARCIAFGRRIVTDIPLPGAIDDDGRHPPEIHIRRVSPRVAADAAAPILRREGATLHFAPRGVAEYRITPTTIEVAPCPGADEDEIAALLIATALPGLLWLDGGIMLHAAAAIMPGRDSVVAIAAPSGMGKSTMLAQLVARGAHMVADDSLCLRPGAAEVAASGLPGGYFAHDPDPSARPFIAVDRRRAVDGGRLGAVLVLSRHAGDVSATLRRLAPLDALTAILSHRHRAAIPALFGDFGRRLGDAARVARIPAYQWSRPDGSAGLTPAEWRAIDRLSGGDGDG